MTDLYRLPPCHPDLAGVIWPAITLILMGLVLTLWLATEYTV